jgi:hypothetical protein
MSAYSGAFGSQGGYNQSGGNYYFTTAAVPVTSIFAYSGQSGSGGATAVGSFAPYSTIAAAGENYSSAFGTTKLIKDMGKTVVSAGRAFRKFQAVNAASSSTGGVAGQAGTSTQVGYLTAYLEVGAPNGGGQGVTAIAPIARYA